MKVTIFYSWQSDTRAAANRTLIQQALEGAAGELYDDDSIDVQPVIDRDTQTVPGAPDIGATIFGKINTSAAIVSDVTIVNGANSGRQAPNPNVLIELGYALKALGDRRLILVQNTAFGGPELLPFDLRQKRVLTYNSAEDAVSRSDERRNLQTKLREALRLVLEQSVVQTTAEYPVVLAIDYRVLNTHAKRHDYQLQVTLKNTGTRPITEWHVDVEIPTFLLEPRVNFALRVPDRSDRERTLMRANHNTHHGAIYPGDTKTVMTIDYRVDDEISRDQLDLFSQPVTATAYVHGSVAGTVTRLVEDLQKF